MIGWLLACAEVAGLAVEVAAMICLAGRLTAPPRD
jgi:hypothetical protein